MITDENFFPKYRIKNFYIHVRRQNVPERVALVCVSSPGLQTFQESFLNNYYNY